MIQSTPEIGKFIRVGGVMGSAIRNYPLNIAMDWGVGRNTC